jgi:hypothetical protein
MRRTRLPFVTLLVLSSIVAGCEADEEWRPEPGSPVPPSPAPSRATHEPPEGTGAPVARSPTRLPSPGKAATSGVVRANRVFKPIVVRASYAGAKRICISGKGFSALANVDAFRVADVIEGRLNASIIHVQPLTSRSPHYPREPTVGATYTLRLSLTEEELKQDESNERGGRSELYVDGDEIEVVSPSPGGKGEP